MAPPHRHRVVVDLVFVVDLVVGGLVVVVDIVHRVVTVLLRSGSAVVPTSALWRAGPAARRHGMLRDCDGDASSQQQ